MSKKPVIEVSGLSTYFDAHCVHDNLNLDIYEGEILAIVGGSGSGKTTLLRDIIKLQEPTSGSIKIFNQEITNIDVEQFNVIQKRMGVMFQQGALFSSLTVQENIAFPMTIHTKLPTELINELSLLKIALVGLPIDAANRYPAELSGGMIKRAAVARAIALDPDLLFLDEPTAGLDPQGAGELDDLILELKASLGLTVVLVTHDLDTLWKITDRVAFLGEKRVLSVADMATLSKSKHPLIHAYFTGPRARTAVVQ